MKNLPRKEAEQLVLDQMDADPSDGLGIRNIRHKIAMSTGQHITRDFVSEVMHTHNPVGFQNRDPGSRKIPRTKKAPIGVHEQWSADGHDKLYRIGFPIWAIVDSATGKWLGAWVVPSNWMAHIVAYLYLCAVEEYGGMCTLIARRLKFKLISLNIMCQQGCLFS